MCTIEFKTKDLCSESLYCREFLVATLPTEREPVTVAGDDQRSRNVR